MTVNLPSVNVAVQPTVLFKKSNTSCIVVLFDVANVYSSPLLTTFIGRPTITKSSNSANVVDVVAVLGVVFPILNFPDSDILNGWKKL